MILTGKALKDFNKWLYENDECYFTDESMQMYNHTLFIYWFDSVGIYIDVGVNQITDKNTNKSNCNFDVAIFHPHHRIEEGRTLTQLNINVSRQKAIEQAIVKANEIYNLKFRE